MTTTVRCCGAALFATLVGCVAPGEIPVDAGQVRIDVAPLSLPGLTDAEYTVTVTNGADGGGDVVWTKALSSTSYGDGAGSLSYVGTCDASDDGVSTVTVALDALRTADGTLDPATYRNPGALSKEVVCLANADVAVTFDLTIVRQAQQGFFDVAVSFEDIFCSAKLDCVNDAGGDLELLHDPDTGARDLTAVLGFACTGAPSGTTWLYMDDLVISCTGLTLDVRVDPTGRGNLDTTAAPNVNADGYLFAASVFRGVEGLAAKAYWNVSLGLDETTFEGAGDCTLTGRATASSEPFPQEIDGFPLPEGSVYPVIDWSVQLSDADGRVCETHAVNEDASGVETHYLGYLPGLNRLTWSDAPIYLDARFEPAADIALRSAAATCNPPCANGECVATDTCDCAGTGYAGATCAEPVCATPCLNGGSCVAPDTCDCAGTGYSGASCDGDVDECVAGTDDCGVDEVCVNTDGGFVCATMWSCRSLYDAGFTTSGVYEIDPDGEGGAAPFDVYCDQDTDGGGWTVFQRRTSSAVDFYRPWTDYRDGFGAASTNHWLGNDRVAAFTALYPSELRVDMVHGGQPYHAAYETFALGDAATGYVLYITGFSGNAGDSLSAHANAGFSTYDAGPSSGCAQSFHGAWWYTSCHSSNLNGAWGSTTYGYGLNWYSLTGYYASVTVSEMKMRELVPANLASCAALRAAGVTVDGVYSVDPDGPGGNPAIDVWCDMTADGGGWTRVFLGANSLHSDALTYETATAPIIGGSTEMMFAYTNTVSYGLTQAWKFPTPAVFVSTTPMAGIRCGYESIDATRLSDGHTTTQLLRYGWGSFSDECDEDCRNAWGQVCLKNNTTLGAAGGYLDFPMYTGFNYSTGDWCASSSGLYSAASCSDTRRFSILVR